MSDGDLKYDVTAHAGMVTFGVGYMAYFSGNPGSSILGLLIVAYAVVCAVRVTGMLVSRRGGSDE